MNIMSECLIIGAGPYGLSLGAHLAKTDVDFRIVGTPMQPWQENMPADMHLKSEGFASSLFEPAKRFTLGAYCAEHQIPYADVGLPVKVDTFVNYGRAFQERFVSNVENRVVQSLVRVEGGFRAVLSDGGTIDARRVVVASGIVHFARIPEELANLPGSLRSHSSEHHDLSRFSGRKVAVIGAGSSAMDMAAALHRNGASVTVIARRKAVRFQSPLGLRTVRDKIRNPMTTIGPGWKSVLCTKAPLLFHLMPETFRTEVVRRYLGPAPAWFTREVVENNVPIITGSSVVAAHEKDGRVHLTLRGGDAATSTLSVDHVIAATGFKVDLGRVGFLGDEMRQALNCADGAPRLSRNFESSVPGLYFVGTASANSFGPMLRFACGAGFTARRLSRHLKMLAARSRQGVARTFRIVQSRRSNAATRAMP
jgi:thioredoxin reductase